MAYLLEVKNLSMFYHISNNKKVRAIDNISFNIEYGETLGVVGESGCGKTSLATSLLCMPSSPGKFEGGSILFEGENILSLKEDYIRKNIRFSKISMVFQGAMNCLIPVDTIGKQMLETLNEHMSMDKIKSKSLIIEYLEYVGLNESVFNMYPHEMSGGMKQRAVIATALFLKPKLIILDEPTTALDVIVQAQIINLLKKLKKEFNLSFIFITHDLALEYEVSDKIAVMYAGEIIELASRKNIYSNAKHPYTEKLLKATPNINSNSQTLDFIEGAPPDLTLDFTGCRFYARCDKRIDKCENVAPVIKEIENKHFCACHLRS